MPPHIQTAAEGKKSPMDADDKPDQDTQELKGHVEEAVGRIFGDDKLVAHGKADQVAAHVKQAATRAGETARLVGQRVRERAMRKLGELHQQLHEAADDAADKAATKGTQKDSDNGHDAG